MTLEFYIFICIMTVSFIIRHFIDIYLDLLSGEFTGDSLKEPLFCILFLFLLFTNYLMKELKKEYLLLIKTLLSF